MGAAIVFFCYAVISTWLLILSVSWLIIPLGSIALTAMLLILNRDITDIRNARLELEKNPCNLPHDLLEKEKAFNHKHCRVIFYIIFVAGAIGCAASFNFYYHSEKLNAQAQHQENTIKQFMKW